MKTFFTYFFYLSLIFLFYSLFKADYLKIPTIFSTPQIFLSFLFLFIGFLFNAYAWKQTVCKANFNISLQHGIISIGLSIFGKYIPGKFWVILARADYIAIKYNYALKDIAALSLNEQFISLWVGLIIGTIGVIVINKVSIYGVSILILLLVLTLVIFTSLFHKFAEKTFFTVFKKNIRLPRLSLNKVIKILPWFVLNWLLWGMSFYLLASGLVEQKIPFNIVCVFALAGSFGILAIVAPGGIGVREGLLAVYLSFNGLSVVDASTIAITSRLWFLIGELFIFLLALFWDRLNKTEVKKVYSK